MAKFLMEDGTTRTTDQILDDYEKYKIKPMKKLKTPNGDRNFIRLGNICDYDLLCHIQQNLNNNNCIIQLITGYKHLCLLDEHYNPSCNECIMNWLNSKEW